MKLVLYNILVSVAFGLLLAHNIIPPHHHHHTILDQIAHSHHDEDHEHGHSPFTLLHIDEVFFVKSLHLKFALQKTFAAVRPATPVFEDVPEIKPCVFISRANASSPLPSLLVSFSYRGPPST